MTKIIEIIHNATTNEITERELNAAESTEFLRIQKEVSDIANRERAAAEAKATARASALAKLAALGLSADEIAAL
jgi:DNA-binding NarL/FixJ family response regulator